MTGPTLSGCTLDSQSASLTVEFNATLLAGETVVLNKYNSSLNNQVAAPPPVTTALEHCFETTKAVCAGNLHNITDCRNCKAVPGAWAKLQAACGSRPINNFHDSCKSFFPVRKPNNAHKQTTTERRHCPAGIYLIRGTLSGVPCPPFGASVWCPLWRWSCYYYC